MQINLIRIGNSRGVRLPRHVIERAGLTDELELEVQRGAVILRNTKTARAEWSQAAQSLQQNPDESFENWDITINDGNWS